MEMLIEPPLFEHGITTENSHIRAHIGVLAKCAFVFPTKSGVDAIEKHKPPLRQAFQEGVNGKTAEGYAVNLEWISDLRILKLTNWPVFSEWSPDLSTSKKGQLAVGVVCEMLKRGRFPLWIDAFDDDRENIQLQGTDIVIFARKRIQVKCDYRSGRRTDHPECTGRLFLQVRERNPLKRI